MSSLWSFPLLPGHHKMCACTPQHNLPHKPRLMGPRKLELKSLKLQIKISLYPFASSAGLVPWQNKKRTRSASWEFISLHNAVATTLPHLNVWCLHSRAYCPGWSSYNHTFSTLISKFSLELLFLSKFFYAFLETHSSQPMTLVFPDFFFTAWVQQS